MENIPQKLDSQDMSPEEVAGVKEGMADFANRRVLTEKQFESEMERFLVHLSSLRD